MNSFRRTGFTFLLFLPALLMAQNETGHSSVIEKRYESQHFGFSAGIWIPTGSLKTLGIHPSLGAQWGFRHRQHEFNVSLDLRFIRSKNPYVLERDGAYYTSDKFFGGYLGLDYVNYLMVSEKAEIGVLAGLGYDGFDLDRQAIPSSPYQIGSLNLNLGMRFNFYTKGETCFSLMPRYNFIKYGNKGGTDFSGNAISFVLFIGGIWGIDEK